MHGAPQNGWALRILAPIQVGLYSLKVTDTNGERISVSQQSVAVVPGVELEIPLGSRTVFKPFGQFGVGHTFGVDAGSPNYYVFLAGARAISQWHAGATTISLGNLVIYAGDTRSAPASLNITFRCNWAWSCAIRSASRLANGRSNS